MRLLFGAADSHSPFHSYEFPMIDSELELRFALPGHARLFVRVKQRLSWP
jgi:hypothetical protein